MSDIKTVDTRLPKSKLQTWKKLLGLDLEKTSYCVAVAGKPHHNATSAAEAPRIGAKDGLCGPCRRGADALRDGEPRKFDEESEMERARR